MIGLATGALMAAIWQGIVLAVIVWLALRFLPKTPAAVRFAIWFGVFLLVAVLPVASLWPHAGGIAKAAAHGPWLTLDARWSLAIAAVWLLASIVRAGTLVNAALRVRSLWKRATPVDLPLAEFASGSRRAQICTSDEVDRPTVIGFFSPKILIPVWLLDKLTPAELEQIVLHEAGHLGRADDWMNLLQKIALVVFPLNPALAWVERRLCFERELAVDDRVLSRFAGKAGAATAYAACLTTLAEHRLERRSSLPLKLALVLGALGRESELGRRVRSILRRGETMKPLHARLVLGGALLGLTVGAIGLERCPEVIGFTPDNAPTVAHAIPVQPARRSLVVRTAFSINGVRSNSKVPRESLLMVHQPIASVPVNPSKPVNVPAPVRMVQTSAAGGARTHSAKKPMSNQDQMRRLVAQWVTVTEWQSSDGSRMVLATARTSGASLPRSYSDTPPDADDAPQIDLMANQQLDQQLPAGADEAHPYAAVPIRGGWLIFQL
ncbi:MAG TPA: M56 family metallopeptidase [Acidobacteriaceae bacterium]|jgi:beta-lactamase regulating signal transducer with metallopeptidase domain